MHLLSSLQKSSSKNRNRLPIDQEDTLTNNADDIWLTPNRLEQQVLRGSVGSSLENSPTLVLNADYTPLSRMPLSLWNWQDSMRAIITGKAKIVSAYSDMAIRTVSKTFPVPSVIVLSQFYRHSTDVPQISRRFVYLRDDYCCQYCEQRFGITELTLDHVIPRSKGGKLVWSNTVTACKACNFRKGSMAAEELPHMGMRLRNKPYPPTLHELQQKLRLMKKNLNYHPHWQDFL